MKRLRAGGFTLIELLTVVAIIAILAAMLFIAGPRVIMLAREASLRNACNQIRTCMTGYMTQNRKSYPPMYGYRVWRSTAHHLMPYTAYDERMHQNDKIYDPFADASWDTDRNGILSYLEFWPKPTYAGVNKVSYPTTWANPPTPALCAGEDSWPNRPLVCIVVNSSQFQKYTEYLDYVSKQPGREEEAWGANCWDSTEPYAPGPNPLLQVSFPPPVCDAFVVVGMGPYGSTGGILADPPFLSQIPAEDRYHVCALRAYFLATRDRPYPPNDPNRVPDGNLDFSYESRRTGTDKEWLLPDGTRGPGAFIYVP